MRSLLLGATAALSALLVSAQNSSFTINPSEVTLGLRASWCTGQTNTCGTLCDNNPEANSCDPNTLDFTCTCKNGSAPGLRYYTQTIYTFVCQQAFQDCIAATVGNANAQQNCTDTIESQCGTLDPANYTASATTSTPSGATSATASSPVSATGVASATSQAAAPTNVQNLGTGALAAGMGLLAYML